MKVLAVLVNYGDEQLEYLQQVVSELKSFKKYEVTVIVQSNIPLDTKGVDKVNVVTLNNYQYLPLTCRKEIWDRRDDYELFIYGENDHLFLEHHIDKHIEYSKILPKDRITGLLQIETEGKGNYYVGYHSHFDWDYNSVEEHGGKKFAYFNNTHQATFILTKEQLMRVASNINFEKLVKFRFDYWLNTRLNSLRKLFKKPIKEPFRYSVKCKVNTDVYDFGGMKKLICVSELEDNLIHHLPNLYIEGIKGRRQFNVDEQQMQESLKKLLN